MRFHLGDIPESADFLPDASWQQLKESSVWRFQLIAFPIGIVAAAVFALLWITVTPLAHEWRTLFPLPVLGFAVCLTGVLIVHELLHAAVHPMAGRWQRTVLGFWPSRMFLYATYEGDLTRNRYFAVLLTPFAVISIVPLVVAGVAQASNVWVAYSSIVNAYLACGDILATGVLLFEVPANAVIRNQGMKAYFREKLTRVEPGAAPTDGPSTQSGNSEVTGGPPSVS